jgi:hypothetical protein
MRVNIMYEELLKTQELVNAAYAEPTASGLQGRKGRKYDQRFIGNYIIGLE